MFDLSDTTLLLLLVYALCGLGVVCLICWTLRHDPQPVPIERYVDLRFSENPNRGKPAWLISIFALLLFLGLLSWASQRDDPRETAVRDIARTLATLQCAPPNAPLEKLVMSIASQADSVTNRPQLTCVYITADLTIPKLRYARPVYAEAN